MATRGHQRQHSMRVALGQEATTNPELKDFTELQCWATRHHNSSLKRPAKKWVRLRDYTLYWCKSPVESQAEGCIRFLYDEVIPELVTDTQLKFKCRDKDRVFEFENKLDAVRWHDRTTKTLQIRNTNGASFTENGRTIFNNVCNMFLLNNNEWIAVGQGTLKIVSDTSDSGGVPDVAAIMTVPSDNGTKSYEFLVCPYIKPKGNKTWILPKVMDMNTDFNQQTLAFRFPSENDAQVFQNVFDNIFRSTDTNTKHDTDQRVKDLEDENRRLASEVELLKKRCERLKEKKDALKKLLQRARVQQGSLDDADMLDDDDDDDDMGYGDSKPVPQTPQDDKSFTPSSIDDNEIEIFEQAMPYKVVGEDGVTVRKGIDLSSEEVCIIPSGEVVLVKERKGRRGRLVVPVDGWCSLRTQGGYVCLQRVEGQEYNEDIVVDDQMEDLLKQTIAAESGNNNELQGQVSKLQSQLFALQKKYSDKCAECEQLAAAPRPAAQATPSYTKEQVMQWTSREVGGWLATIGLGNYADKFEDMDVDGSILLLDLDENLLLNELGFGKSDMDTILSEIQRFAMNTSGGGGAASSSVAPAGPAVVDISALTAQLQTGAFRDALRSAVRAKAMDLRRTVRSALAGGDQIKELSELKEKALKYEASGSISRREFENNMDAARRAVSSGLQKTESDTNNIITVVEAQLQSTSRDTGELRSANSLLTTEVRRKDSRLQQIEQQIGQLQGGRSYY